MTRPSKCSLYTLSVILLQATFSGASQPLQSHGLTYDPALFSCQDFDIIFAGGGTAGISAAARLAQRSSLRIGVIEAGNFIVPNSNQLVDTPELAGQSFADPALAWQFNTIPQKRMEGRSIFYPRGKMVGGSSGINAMAWVRPPKQELDSWPDTVDISKEWTWSDLLPYMMKVENVSVDENPAFPYLTHPSGYNNAIQGRKGPIQVSFDNTFTGVETPLVESFRNAGGVINQDPADGNNIGVFNSQHAVDRSTGNRSYATTGYYVPNKDRSNLLVLSNATVSKVILKGSKAPFKATGLEFIVDSKLYSVKASREVVLSAGAIKTPQLLELSGIGDKSRLSKFGIKTLIDAPFVGENFQDHNSITTSFLLKDPAPITLDTLQNNKTFFLKQENQYLVNHTGLLTTLPTYSYFPLQTFFSSSEVACLNNTIEAEIRDRKLAPLYRKQFEKQLEWLKQGTVSQLEMALYPGGIPGLPNPLVPGRSYVSLVLYGQHLYSRGTVHINSTNALIAPTINPNFFDFTFDREVLKMGIKVAKRIAATSPLSDLIESMTNPSTDNLDDYVNENAGLEYNAIGTAVMASRDLGGVVGGDFIVYGTSNLRVIDSSIIPFHVAAHLTTLVFGIAEKATDEILQKNKT